MIPLVLQIHSLVPFVLKEGFKHDTDVKIFDFDNKAKANFVFINRQTLLVFV